MADRYPLTVFGRLLTCTRCGAHVDLIDIDLTNQGLPWILAGEYVCDIHLEPVNRTAEYPPRVIHPHIHGEPPAPPAWRAA